MRSAGEGSSRDSACSFEIDGSSQTRSASVGRIIGIRSCTGATNSFGVVVMIVQLSSTCPFFSSVRDVPEAGESEHLMVGQLEVDRLLLAVSPDRPFEDRKSVV